ncbi:MAG: outer membrane protein assembly factor BamD, partial [Caulobacteraceae bacterium]
MAAATGVTGCKSFTQTKQRKEQQAYQERPVETLYNLGASLMDRGVYDGAVLYFREVERQHPYSEWARRAIMMQAYAAYRQRDYTTAVSEADRFVQLYPGNPSAAYAYYLKALCYYDQIVDVGRDQGGTEQAQAALRELVRRFPGTDYAADAQLKLDLGNDQLAGKEMNVGRFYLQEGKTLAAINRFKNVIDKFQTTNQTPEALYRLVEANLTLGLVDEANRNAAVLGANYPGDEWYADAYRLMTGRGQTLEIQPVTTRRLRNGFGLFGGRQKAPPATQE